MYRTSCSRRDVVEDETIPGDDFRALSQLESCPIGRSVSLDDARDHLVRVVAHRVALEVHSTVANDSAEGVRVNIAPSHRDSGVTRNLDTHAFVIRDDAARNHWVRITDDVHDGVVWGCVLLEFAATNLRRGVIDGDRSLALGSPSACDR